MISVECEGCGRQRKVVGFWDLSANCRCDERPTSHNYVTLIEACDCKGVRDAVMKNDFSRIQGHSFLERISDGFSLHEEYESDEW